MTCSQEPALGRVSDLGEPGRLTFIRAWPADDLAGLVLGYSGYDEVEALNLAHRMPASTFVPVIINFGPPFLIHPGGRPQEEAGRTTFAAGLIDRYTVVRSHGRSACMQVDFTPFGARAFLGLPMNEIADQVVDLRDLLGRAADDLTERLWLAPAWQDRFLLLDRFVRARLARGPAVSAPVRLAWHMLARSRGTVRIADVAAALDWSRKHLAQRFAAEIGHRPKAVARIMRVNHALHLGLSPAPDWADIALRAGYSDQAHLIREFRDMVGHTPGEIAAGR